MAFLRNLIRDALLRRFHVPRDMVRWALKHHAARCVLRTDTGATLTYAELGERIYTLAAGLLSQGMRPGECVAFTLPNCTAFVELRLACYEAGLVSVPLIWDLPAAARADILRQTGARLHVFDPNLSPSAADCVDTGQAVRSVAVDPADGGALDNLRAMPADSLSVPVDADTVATINFTSGTTGAPKGVQSTHGAWCRSAKMLIRAARMKPGRDERVLHGVPLATAGWGIFLPSFLGGMTSYLLRAYDPGADLALVEREKITRVFLTPSQLVDWIDHADVQARDLSSLRRIYCGTAPLHGAKLAEAQERFGRIIQGGYGMAEVLPPVAVWAAGEQRPALPYRAGRVMPDVTVRVVDENGQDAGVGVRGEIWIRSPTQTKGYYGREDRTRIAVQDGFFRTGDLGFVDGQGHLNVLGRLADVVHDIPMHPREVEERVHEVEGVKECALAAATGKLTLAYSTRRGVMADEGALTRVLTACGLGTDVDLYAVKGDLPRSAAGKVLRGQCLLP